MLVSSLRVRKCLAACLSSQLTTNLKHSPLPIPPLLPRISLLRFLSVQPNEDSPAFSLLVESLGLPPEIARSVCRKLQGKISKNAGPVIIMLKNHGFSADQICAVVNRCPQALGLNPEKTLLPKLEFFGSKGLLGPDLAVFISSCPYILWRSLDRLIIPHFNFFRSILKSNEKTLRAVRRIAWAGSTVAPNIRYLLDNGVSESNVAGLLLYVPTVLYSSHSRLREAMQVSKEMGLDPRKSMFQNALLVVLGMSKSSWESKARVYRNWGWSEEELLSAFRKYPLCMAVSEDKINRVMSFFVDRMGWKPSLIAQHPILFSQSLEKKTIPRGSVLQFLLSEGLFEKHYSLTGFFTMNETAFMKRVAARYPEAAPRILAIYKGANEQTD
ncbi:hypothetical protein CRG98_014547 [Punica granatum]|uniref:Uncharacterized protein n=1 Tax=Punica granatum TaxID=22663 RepID=A0A2I0K947_PUNGR|nr:hypothetical protein CRG98_014547 [Punica granatum]